MTVCYTELKIQVQTGFLIMIFPNIPLALFPLQENMQLNRFGSRLFFPPSCICYHLFMMPLYTSHEWFIYKRAHRTYNPDIHLPAYHHAASFIKQSCQSSDSQKRSYRFSFRHVLALILPMQASTHFPLTILLCVYVYLGGGVTESMMTAITLHQMLNSSGFHSNYRRQVGKKKRKRFESS